MNTFEHLMFIENAELNALVAKQARLLEGHSALIRDCAKFRAANFDLQNEVARARLLAADHLRQLQIAKAQVDVAESQAAHHASMRKKLEVAHAALVAESQKSQRQLAESQAKTHALEHELVLKCQALNDLVEEARRPQTIADEVERKVSERMQACEATLKNAQLAAEHWLRIAQERLTTCRSLEKKVYKLQDEIAHKSAYGQETFEEAQKHASEIASLRKSLAEKSQAFDQSQRALNAAESRNHFLESMINDRMPHEHIRSLSREALLLAYEQMRIEKCALELAYNNLRQDQSGVK